MDYYTELLHSQYFQHHTKSLYSDFMQRFYTEHWQIIFHHRNLTIEKRN